MRQSTGFAYSSTLNWFNAGMEYSQDRWQRLFLYGDIMRRRGNNYLDHLRAGQPPVLVFKYDMIMSGMDFDPPVNYALVKIRNRRGRASDRRNTYRKTNVRRKGLAQEPRPKTDATRRPLVVIDPRAGHGPGIGGSKLNSQIGVALNYGYPVYFIMFSPEPAPGQTIAAIQQTEIKFLEEVARRHADAPKPAVIGNCQAGWAAALIGADRPDVVGPMVFNGSPLSYWGGVEGANPMRYKGGLIGGMWMASLLSDLGAGQFDGAHLVAGFEDLNPANTYWTKQYHLFTHVDTDERRFLDFEKWWGGFFKLGAKEINFITRSLFVGNELEKGLVELQEGHPINLHTFNHPIFVFPSCGDNITPPPQALNWIYKVYGSVKEIKRNGQTIIYMVHKNIGHLGIFVSGKVVSKEHREIIGCLDMIEYLVPGLYEMVIKANASNSDIEDYTVQFEARDMADILAMDDGLEDEAAFVPVDAISQANDRAYRKWIQPWIRAFIQPWMAEGLRQLHPLRIQRYACSDANPFAWPLAAWSAIAKQHRRPVSQDNPFVAAETYFSNAVIAGLNFYRDIRDNVQEWLFKSIYENPWTGFLWGTQSVDIIETRSEEHFKRLRKREQAYARRNASRGGFSEAVIRIIIAVTGVDRVFDKRQVEAAESVIQRLEQFQNLSPTELKQLVRNQARILSAQTELAISSLASILSTKSEREKAFDVALKIAIADSQVDLKERELLSQIRSTLELDHDDIDV
jgi:pimeloyl-ACP methyl ester carboxylesterase/tellurite resistance protein